MILENAAVLLFSLCVLVLYFAEKKRFARRVNNAEIASRQAGFAEGFRQGTCSEREARKEAHADYELGFAAAEEKFKPKRDDKGHFKKTSQTIESMVSASPALIFSVKPFEATETEAGS